MLTNMKNDKNKNFLEYQSMDEAKKINQDFCYLPYKVQESCRILRVEILKHGDFYKAFVASAKSGILDCPKGSKPHEMAEFIVKRLIGEE